MQAKRKIHLSRISNNRCIVYISLNHLQNINQILTAIQTTQANKNSIATLSPHLQQEYTEEQRKNGLYSPWASGYLMKPTLDTDSI